MTGLNLTDEYTLLTAKMLAEFCNGGDWNDYQPQQKQVWIDRIKSLRTQPPKDSNDA